MTASVAGSSIDKSKVAQKAKTRNLYNKNNFLPTNTSTFEAAIHSINITCHMAVKTSLSPLLVFLFLTSAVSKFHQQSHGFAFLVYVQSALPSNVEELLTLLSSVPKYSSSFDMTQSQLLCSSFKPIISSTYSSLIKDLGPGTV